MLRKLKTIFLLPLSAMLLFSACSSNNGTAGITEKETDASSKDDKNKATETIGHKSENSARVSVAGTDFVVNGRTLWINGVNTPWQKWNDFTGNMDEEFWDNEFARLAGDNINCTRIWLNCNGEGIIRLDNEGNITGINEKHWDNLDRLFKLAEKHKVYVMPTFLSFDHFKEPKSSAGKWQALISDKAKTDKYAEKYVKEFCTRYADEEYIFAIDIMNEPDWVYENEECGRIGWEQLSYFFGKCAAVIHENSDILVTVGIGIIKYNSDEYEGNKVSDEYLRKLTDDSKAYLDFYSTHYYNWQKPWFGFPWDKSPYEFGLKDKKPCIIGETHNDDATEINMTLADKYKSVYENGWNGIMVWMQFTDSDYVWYRYDLTQLAANAMAELIPEKIHPYD